MNNTLFRGNIMQYKIFNTLPQEAIEIRTAVFIEEQGFQQEFDDIDNNAYHLIIYENNRPIANGRLYKDNTKENAYIIGRLAVIKTYRNKHLGAKLMMLLEAQSKKLHANKISLSAQCQAQNFYEKLGYTPQGEIYLDEHCPHIHMEKTIK